MNNYNDIDSGFARLIYKDLTNWKNSTDRRVLLLRGARQVGKTFSIRQLAKQMPSYLEVNFLETPEICSIFQTGNLAPEPIISKLQIYYGVSIIPGETLLFFDEIQACPEALTALRFFYEKVPKLHVVASGSLVEFALNEIPSFGVGRIDSLFMYPMNFSEFLVALGQSQLDNILSSKTDFLPLDEIFHKKLINLLKLYSMLGGLPKVVDTYVNTNDVNKCLPIQENLLLGYEDDFGKYKTRIHHEKLRDTLKSCALQAGKKFVYSHINPGQSISGYDQAVQLLELAGLVHRVYHTSANGIPVGSELDRRKFKVIPFDIGIYNRLVGLSVSEILMKEEVFFVNKGALAEVFVGLEIISNHSAQQRAELYYWSREAQASNAEVDYIIQTSSDLLPLEVKSGSKGQMQSLYRFLNEKRRQKGVRTSLENFAQIKTPESPPNFVDIIPLYAIGAFMRRNIK